MRTISVTLQLLGVLVLLSLGYWVWFANWGPNPNDRIGVAVSRWMPGPVKDWGCGKLNQRFAVEAPTECSPAAATPAPSAPGAPPQPTPDQPGPDGGGRL